MTYACPAWEFAAESHLLKLQCLQNRVLCTIGNFPRCTSVRELHVAFQILYVYDFITKLCRQQAEIIQNHDNENVRNIRQGKARHRKYKRLKLGGGRMYDRSSHDPQTGLDTKTYWHRLRGTCVRVKAKTTLQKEHLGERCSIRDNRTTRNVKTIDWAVIIRSDCICKCGGHPEEQEAYTTGEEEANIRVYEWATQSE
jgi:hypothetical protein